MVKSTSTNHLSAYEKWLKIDDDGPTAVVMRARAVYLCGWAFVLLQTANLVSMTLSYGRLTHDHIISFAAIALVVAAIHSLRYVKEFTWLAAFFSMLLLGGVFASAFDPITGVNSALLPLLVTGPAMNGMIAGWRTSIVFGVLAAALTIGLFFVSQGSGGFLALDPAWYETRSAQRAIQCVLALSLMTAISSIFSRHMYAAFDSLESAARKTKEAEDNKAAFLANISRELQAPLKSISDAAVLQHTANASDGQREFAKIIAASSRSLATLVDDITEYARLDSETSSFASRPFNLHELLKRVVELQMPNAHAKSLDLHLHIDETLPEFFLGDVARLRQVFVNLVSNAIKFTQIGEVRITACLLIHRAGETTFQINIADTGVGMTRQVLAKAFDTNDDDGSIEKPNGLAVSRRIVRFMGGKLSVETEPGAGSTFSVRLTLPTAEESGSESKQHSAA